MSQYKLAVLTSHVIQYQTPLFVRLAGEPEINLTVYFNWDFGAKKTYDKQFGRYVEWDIPLLKGFKYKFLKNFSLNPSSDFWGQVNPGIVLEIARNKYDAILVYGWNGITNWLAFFTAFLTKTPVLFHGENPLNQEKMKAGLKQRFKRAVLQRLFRRVSAFLYIGKENKEFYEYFGVPENKLFFCPYAVHNERLMANSKEQGDRPLRNAAAGKENSKELRKELGIDKQDTVILFVGKLMPKKRPMDLLKAYEIVTRNTRMRADMANEKNINSHYGLHLVFVGDGELRSELENYAKEKGLLRMPRSPNSHTLANSHDGIHFTGFQNQSDLPKFYAMADIFVLPSGIGETWGLVVNEAMCFGKPVIVSDIVGCGRDLVRDGENGYRFPVGDIQALAERIAELAADADKRERFGKKSLEIIQKYSYREDVHGIIQALRKIK